MPFDTGGRKVGPASPEFDGKGVSFGPVAGTGLSIACGAVVLALYGGKVESERSNGGTPDGVVAASLYCAGIRVAF